MLKWPVLPDRMHRALSNMPRAGLPARVKRKDWVLMPRGKSPVHSDADRDVGTHGYCFFSGCQRLMTL